MPAPAGGKACKGSGTWILKKCAASHLISVDSLRYPCNEPLVAAAPDAHGTVLLHPGWMLASAAFRGVEVPTLA